ncbi:uncharacterized protein LOC133722723 [Rosa rugosa]|uniref:uncharacterized protein LOC133722723 n=1 Tax=Rosa rugosa TaxID=74645 RepID=UPI002B416410|nr:uncharacterized protein LOC133722723 [Rosa rugosa]
MGAEITTPSSCQRLPCRPNSGSNATATFLEPSSLAAHPQLGNKTPKPSREDEYIWGPSSNGRFSIKSATWLQYDHLHKYNQSKLIYKLWNLNVQPKIKIFGWLLLRGRLKTRDRLSKFGIINDNSCPLCNRDNETADHLFGYCDFTKEVWRLANINTSVDWEEGYLKVFEELFLLQPYNADLFAKTITLCWQVWKTRNNVIFITASANPMSVVMSVEVIMKSFDDFNTISRDSTASGFIIRDHDARPVIAATKYVGNSTTPVAEATALRDSLITAKDKGFTRLEVEGDSKLVINAVNGIVTPPWRLLKLIEDIRTIATSFSQISFKHIYREANFIADAIANLGHEAMSPLFWSDKVPSEASRALLFDVVNIGCPRGFFL